MNFGQMQDRVFRELQESSTAPAYWSVADVKAALNEGLACISDASEWYEQTTIIPHLSGRIYYDLRTCLPPGVKFLAPRRVYSSVGQRWQSFVNVRELDYLYRAWERVFGDVGRVFTRGLYWLGIYPKQSTDGKSYVRFTWTGLPPDMVNSFDTPGFPEEYHQGIVYYALYDLKVQERETARAMGYWKQYITYQQALANHIDQRVTKDRMMGFRSIVAGYGV